MSEQVPVYIKEVALVDFKGFRGEHRFSFVDEKREWCRWTVFLGNNNTGKTNLLKAIASLEPQKSINYDEKINYFPQGYRSNFIDKESCLGLNLYPNLLEKDGEFASMFRGLSLNMVYNNYSSTGSDNSLYSNLLINGYGVIRNIERTALQNELIDNLSNAESLFHNTNLLNFEDWLLRLQLGANNPNSENKEKFSINRDLLKKVLTGDIFPEIRDIRFISDEKLNNYIEFETTDGWHKMSELGYGYQATLSWMADFCKKMFDRYPSSPNPLKEPAVLLIDEIDLHLHPQWQRGLIQSLSDIFPQTQFIVTTHSPFIIQSMENVNLYTLNRVGDHTEVKHLGNRSYIGWKIEEILSEVMGLDEKIHTDRYNELIAQFDEALDNDDYAKGKKAYDELMQILHPQSAERKLLDIQFTQLTPTE